MNTPENYLITLLKILKQQINNTIFKINSVIYIYKTNKGFFHLYFEMPLMINKKMNLQNKLLSARNTSPNNLLIRKDFQRMYLY